VAVSAEQTERAAVPVLAATEEMLMIALLLIASMLMHEWVISLLYYPDEWNVG
jgi:hypothetical protein